MNQRRIIIISGFLIIVGVIGEILLNSISLNIKLISIMTEVILTIGRISGIILIIKNGKLLMNKRLLPIFLVFIGILTIGFIIKFMHWPYSHIILLTASSGIWLTYFIHFIKKQSKLILDILKVFWLSSLILIMIFIFQHYPFVPGLRIIEMILFLSMFFTFTRNKLIVETKIEE